MSEQLFDFDGWRKAIGPAVRTVGYTAVIYLITYIVVVLPSSLLVAYAGAPQSFLDAFIAPIVIIFLVFAFFLSLFKVIDEERPGQIQLDMSN